jgi:HEPN domain-containing protein
MRSRRSPNYDAVCFHAQQCAEKYLKACLQEAAVPFPRTHDLTVLLDLLLPSTPALAGLRSALDTLSAYAVDPRYPGLSVDKATAQDAARLCRVVRLELRQILKVAP